MVILGVRAPLPDDGAGADMSFSLRAACWVPSAAATRRAAWAARGIGSRQSIASKSAGPGTRANIDEFTETTSAAIEQVGGAARGKAIIIMNPAEPPMIMRDTVHALTSRLDEAARAAVQQAVDARVAEVAEYVPGYRAKQRVQFVDVDSRFDALVPADRAQPGGYTQVSVFLEVEGAAMYLPEYAGNLDIMTSAALRAAERKVQATKELAA